MFVILTCAVLCILIQISNAGIIFEDYNHTRSQILQEEAYVSVGGRLKLNNDEAKVNDILMHWKRKELEDTLNNPKNFNLSKHYFSYKNHIEKSKVYQIIKQMPKGGALHVHSSQMLNADGILNLTYMANLYACYTEDNIKFYFSETVPNRPCSVNWARVSDLRYTSGNITAFDSKLKRHFTMYSEYDEDLDFTDINTVWERFNKVHHVVKSLISYRPAREKFYYACLQNFYDDNIMYVEMRSGVSSLYELNGTVHDKLYLADLYQSVTNKFMRDHPDFIGMKLILTKSRAASIEEVRESLRIARILKQKMPNMFAGFDLVGQEDLGKPLINFVPVLAEAKDEIDFFFHGGETNWFGTSSDENLVDAVLLESKRIGHAYALVKHPYLLEAVKHKDIGLELNVISNGVLALVGDIRNHPLATYLALGLPVVLSSDDPGSWGAEPLSHDFYVTFLGIANSHADLRLLKQLAINSIRYSALTDAGKTKSFRLFNRKWKEFIRKVINENYNYI